MTRLNVFRLQVLEGRLLGMEYWYENEVTIQIETKYDWMFQESDEVTFEVRWGGCRANGVDIDTAKKFVEHMQIATAIATELNNYHIMVDYKEEEKEWVPEKITDAQMRMIKDEIEDALKHGYVGKALDILTGKRRPKMSAQ